MSDKVHTHDHSEKADCCDKSHDHDHDAMTARMNTPKSTKKVGCCSVPGMPLMLSAAPFSDVGGTTLGGAATAASSSGSSRFTPTQLMTTTAFHVLVSSESSDLNLPQSKGLQQS